MQPRIQMSEEGLRNDSCYCILNDRVAIWEVFKRWHLLRSPLDILSTPLTVLCHPATSCLLPCCDHGLHQILVFLAGQAACCVWHSSFIDGLFINCSWGVASFSSLLSRGSSSYWGPTRCGCWELHAWLWMDVTRKKITCSGFFFSALRFLFCCHFTLTPSHCELRGGGEKGGNNKTKDVFI